MTDGHVPSQGHGQPRRSSGHSQEPAIQVICLGAGGGPSEDDVTGFLVRSTAAQWAKNSVLAVDAGSHLGSITRILNRDFPLVSTIEPAASPRSHPSNDQTAAPPDSPSPGTATLSFSDEDSGLDTPTSDALPVPTLRTLESGAFAGLPFPHASARANALHVVREHIATYLITHPHLDHVSGFVINTAAFHNTSRPKRLAALPFTVNAIKTHIFNNIVWPNLTDEDGGVGLVTFQRLQEGGNIALGEGSGRGYIEVCDGLGVRGFKVSHGNCIGSPKHLHRSSNAGFPETPSISRANTQKGDYVNADMREGRSMSFSLPTQSGPATPLFTASTADAARASSGGSMAQAEHGVIDSSAYFIRTEATQHTPTREILMFGDVEPDSISANPRTAHVWAEAAPKIAHGTLAAIFLECSYTNAQGDAFLYGHLSPRHILAELENLAGMVKEARKEHEREREEARKGRKRKRHSNGLLVDGASLPAGTSILDTAATARKTSRSGAYHASPATANAPTTNTNDEQMADCAPSPTPAGPGVASRPHVERRLPTDAIYEHKVKHHHNATSSHGPAPVSSPLAPLKNLKIIIMHVKDSLADGPLVGDLILKELVQGEAEMAQKGRGLGCRFEVARGGGSYLF